MHRHIRAMVLNRGTTVFIEQIYTTPLIGVVTAEIRVLFDTDRTLDKFHESIGISFLKKGSRCMQDPSAKSHF